MNAGAALSDRLGALFDTSHPSHALITGDLDVGRSDAMHLIGRVELFDDRAVIVPKVAAASCRELRREAT